LRKKYKINIDKNLTLIKIKGAMNLSYSIFVAYYPFSRWAQAHNEILKISHLFGKDTSLRRAITRRRQDSKNAEAPPSGGFVSVLRISLTRLHRRSERAKATTIRREAKR